MSTSLFSCKGLYPKEALALQILGYTTISLLSEKFEEDPQILMKAFASSSEKAQPQQQEQEYDPLQGMVESVNICPAIWEAVWNSVSEPKIFFEKLLELDASVKTREDLDNVLYEIQNIENDVPELFRIIGDFFMNECLSEERIQIILEKVAVATAVEVAPVSLPQKHRGRSKTLRVHGRRAITPLRSRHKRSAAVANSY
jgi:hypothetical protein